MAGFNASSDLPGAGPRKDGLAPQVAPQGMAGSRPQGPLVRFLMRHPSILWFLGLLALFTISMTVMSEGLGYALISTSTIKMLGKTLCFCLVAIAMDLVWGYCGILSLGHFAFFGLGGYMIGMWLMYARTEIIVVTAGQAAALPLSPDEVREAIGTQIFGVVGGSDFPIIWAFADNLWIQLALVVAVPGALAFVFGWLAFRSRVTGVYFSILSQAMTLALALYLFQNDSGLRGNNGLSGLQNLPGLEGMPQGEISLWFFWASALALGLGFVLAKLVVLSKFGNIIQAVRDNESRVRFLGYPVESYKLFIFVVSALIAAVAGALYYPQAGIINPAELAPVASIYLAVWVAIGGRGRLYGAVIGAAFVSLLSSWFTGGQIPNIHLGLFTLRWVDWWVVLLGMSFVAATLYAPQGLGGLIDKFRAANKERLA